MDLPVMRHTALGHGDSNVSRVCLRTIFRLGRDLQTCVDAIKAAGDMGCNYIDTANVYRNGFSERAVGRAISGRRDQFVVETKVGTPMRGDQTLADLSRQAIMRDAEGSPARLETDYIDVFCIRADHNPFKRTIVRQ